MITKNGSAVAYVISPDEYDSWNETLAVKSDADLIKEIKSGLDKINKGESKTYSLEELFE
jgi:PHD/YefM family antitoxin component YafN of YafNO toxin-antitoxin module